VEQTASERITLTGLGLVAITGVQGVGKTTLVRASLARVAPPQLTTMVLWQARFSCLAVLTLMARRVDVQVTTDKPEALRPQIPQRLTAVFIWIQHNTRHGQTIHTHPLP
jgi:ABC-type glutathione transport system ATPase component